MLRERLRGPSMAAYYPRRVATFKDLERNVKKMPDAIETWDDKEEDRLEHLNLARARGKGAPKKKRTKEGKFQLLDCRKVVGCGTDHAYD